jgi:hypothetical protein
VDDLVPGDDELRRIERLIDCEHVRVTALPCYKPGGAGRSGTDPAVLVRLALVLAWRGCRRCGWCCVCGGDGHVDPAVFGVRAD